MKVNLLIFFFFLFTTNSYCTAGFGDWKETTPNGNEIDNNKSIYLKNNASLDNLYKWYFYNDYVVGVLGYPDSNENLNIRGYFIINEKTFEIRTFISEKEWMSFIETNHLKPRYITRWYTDEWKFFDETIFVIILSSFLISFPLLLLFLIIFYFSFKKALKKEKFSLLKPNTIFVTSVICFVFIRFIFEYFPQSF